MDNIILYNDRQELLKLSTIKGRTFTATVIDNRDPEKRGRLRVSISNINHKIYKTKQPYLPTKSSTDYSGNKSNSIPPVNSRVEVYCPTEDLNDAIIVGQINSIPPKGQ